MPNGQTFRTISFDNAVPRGVTVRVITVIAGRSPETAPGPYCVTAAVNGAPDFVVGCATFEEAQAVAAALASQRGAVSHE